MTWILYGALIVWVIYMMYKGGGCCGGHMGHEGHGSSKMSGSGCCGGGHMDHTAHTGHEGHDTGNMMNNTIGTIQDPVCGMYVSKQDAVVRQINGQIYYFCSENCANEFEAKHK